MKTRRPWRERLTLRDVLNAPLRILLKLLYTSGTTGHSKAVLLSHNNLVTNLYEGTDLIDDCFDEQSILISLLPMAHAYGSTSAFLSIMYKGSRICFLKRKPTPEYLQRVFKSVKPTILGGVPLIFEKIYQKKILPQVNSSRLLKASLAFPPFRKLFHLIAGRSILSLFRRQSEMYNHWRSLFQ